MALSTFSTFYYGHEITVENNAIPFDEGAGELTAELNVGFYSLTEFAAEAERALNDAGLLTYTVAVNRNTRLITISAGSNFDLLFLSGTSAGMAATDLLGFAANDFTSASTYTGTLASGFEYRPQFILQDYIPKDNNLELTDAVVNRAANGRVQVIRFGSERIFKMNIKFITDLEMDGLVIRNNPTGLEDARDFFDFIVLKGNFEFMPDIGSRSTFYQVILESTPKGKNGTQYEFKELTGSNIPDVYETGVIELRLIED